MEHALTMNAEIISIGDELTSGQRLDTNSQWLSQQLHDLGIRVLYHTTVGDDHAANVRIFREAVDRADVIIATGGLGPTADDLTRQVVAEVAGVELALDHDSLEHIRRLFAKRQRPMPERNNVQALFPKGSRVIPNPHGTAPGIDIDFPREGRRAARLFCLPGVPAEMREMWQATIIPALMSHTGNRRLIRHHCIKCFGIGESDLEAMLPDLIRRGRKPEVGITVSQATISLRITAEGESEQECFDSMADTITTIHTCLGELVFGEGEHELEHAVLRQLRAEQRTLAVAECGTAGLVTKWLCEAAGDSHSFRGGLVGPSVEQLSQLLHVDPSETAELNNSVSKLASAVREHSKADFGLAIGPFPPANDPLSFPVWFAVSDASKTEVSSLPFSGHPDVRPSRMAKQALNLLRLRLQRAKQPTTR